MAQNLFVIIKIFTTKVGEVEEPWSPFIINRFFSMSNIENLRQTAFKMDKYIFILDREHRDLLKLMYDINIDKQRSPWIKYIKKPSEKNEDFKEIIKEFQDYFKWTDNEKIKNAPLLIREFKNKDNLFKILNFIGANKNLYRKYGLTSKLKEEQEKPKAKVVNLASWGK